MQGGCDSLGSECRQRRPEARGLSPGGLRESEVKELRRSQKKEQLEREGKTQVP